MALGWILFVVVIADWGFQHEQLAYETPLLLETIRTTGLKYSEDGQKAFEERNKNDALIVTAPLRSLPQLLTEVDSQVEKALPQRKHQIGIFELPTAVYRLALLAAAPALLGLSLLRLWRVRKLHEMLSPLAGPMSEVQQLLNSPFYERVTKVYGEKRGLHLLTVLLLHSPLLLSSIWYVPGVLISKRENLIVMVTEIGHIFPADELRFEAPTHFTVMWIVSILLSLAGSIVVAALATKRHAEKS